MLTKTARRIEPTDGVDVQRLFGQLVETMEGHGVGLAAPQVGLSLRMFVALDPESEEVRGYVNPQITWFSDERDVGAEGCLSIPGWHAFVERSKSIRLKYQDLEFAEREEEFTGYYARILQHEFDHLNGVLISDRAVDGMHEDKDEETEEVGPDDAVASPAA